MRYQLSFGAVAASLLLLAAFSLPLSARAIDLSSGNYYYATWQPGHYPAYSYDPRSSYGYRGRGQNYMYATYEPVSYQQLQHLPELSGLPIFLLLPIPIPIPIPVSLQCLDVGRSFRLRYTHCVRGSLQLLLLLVSLERV